MSELDHNQQLVVNEARKRLSAKPWYQGVCMDNIPSEEKCINDFEGAVSSVEMETAYHDADDFFHPND